MPNSAPTHHRMRCNRGVLSLSSVLLAACAARGEEPHPGTPAPPGPSSADLAVRPPPAPTPDPPPPPAPRRVSTLPPEALGFEGSCDPGPVVTVAAIGDLLFHHELQRQVVEAPDRFLNLWSSIADLLAAADVTYANLECPAAHGITRKDEIVPDPGLRFDNKVYSGYARFNVHPSVAEDLVRTGVDVVSTANNHALDRGSLGIDRTLDALDAAGLRHTGTRRRGSDEPWTAITTAAGLTIAWVACTLHTNFGRDLDHQVLHCFAPGDPVAGIVADLHADPSVDAVIVTPHWGREYEVQPAKKQVDAAQRWIDAGATAIIGNHSHVLSPWEKRVASDGREAFVIYSLGNFVSHQRTLNRCSSMILYLGLRKAADGVTRVVGARYVPLYVRMEGDKERFFVESIDRAKGPEDARRLVESLYGEANHHDPAAPLDLTDHCRDAEPL